MLCYACQCSIGSQSGGPACSCPEPLFWFQVQFSWEGELEIVCGSLATFRCSFPWNADCRCLSWRVFQALTLLTQKPGCQCVPAEPAEGARAGWSAGRSCLLSSHLSLFLFKLLLPCIALSRHVRKAFSVFEPGLRCIYP